MAYVDTLAHHCLRDAKIQAFASPLIDFPIGYRGGPVLDQADHQRYRHRRGGRSVDSVQADQVYEAALEGDYIYAGPMCDHFGHFMAEMVHRIMPARLLGLPGRFLFVTTQEDTRFDAFDALPPFARDVFAFFGLSRDDVVVVNRNTTVERLHLVAQESDLGGHPNTGYLDALRDHASGVLDRLFAGAARPPALYVSRSGWAKAGSFLGERAFEAALERAGYTVFHPEQHSLLVQMDHYRQAQAVIFSGGSACHGVELLGTGMLGSVVLIPRTSRQIVMFERVLRPRASTFVCAPEAIYLGSLFRNGQDGDEADHRGVSIYAVDRLLASLGLANLPPVTKPSMAPFFFSAVADLAAYTMESSREGGGRAAARAPVLYGRLFREIARQGAERLPRTSQPQLTAPPAAREPETVQVRVLSKAEVGEIWAASAHLGVPYRNFVRLAVTTLQLRPDLLALRWSDLSPDRSLWSIPADRSKTGKAKRVPVSAAARAVLAELAGHRSFELVLTSTGRPLAGLASQKSLLDAEIANQRGLRASDGGGGQDPMKPWVMNDLRRSAMVIMDKLGIDREVAFDILGLELPPDVDPGRSLGRQHDAQCALALDLWAQEVIEAANRIRTTVD